MMALVWCGDYGSRSVLVVSALRLRCNADVVIACKKLCSSYSHISILIPFITLAVSISESAKHQPGVGLFVLFFHLFCF